MVNKYVVIRTSSIHKRGVFAKRDIPRGSMIIEYVGDKVTKAVGEGRGAEREVTGRKNGSGRVYIFSLNKRYDIDGNVSYNKAKWINHSCKPNCEAVHHPGKIWIEATRDIAKGEELTYNYGYQYANYLEHPCYCDHHNCVGYIVDSRHHWRLKKKKAICGSKILTTSHQ